MIPGGTKYDNRYDTKYSSNAVLRQAIGVALSYTNHCICNVTGGAGSSIAATEGLTNHCTLPCDVVLHNIVCKPMRSCVGVRRHFFFESR